MVMFCVVFLCITLFFLDETELEQENMQENILDDSQSIKETTMGYLDQNLAAEKIHPLNDQKLESAKNQEKIVDNKQVFENNMSPLITSKDPMTKNQEPQNSNIDAGTYSSQLIKDDKEKGSKKVQNIDNRKDSAMEKNQNQTKALTKPERQLVNQISTDAFKNEDRKIHGKSLNENNDILFC